VKKPIDKSAPTLGRGSVSAAEVLTLRECGRRLGLGPRIMREAQRQGLRTVLLGRLKFVLGCDVLDFFLRLADAQAGGARGDEDVGGPMA